MIMRPINLVAISVFLLFSTSQATPIPSNDLSNVNNSTSCIESSQCEGEETPEKSTGIGFGLNYVANLYQKGKEFLFGKSRCHCCCSDRTESIGVRDIPSGNEKRSSCETGSKIINKGKNCGIGTAACCCVVGVGLGKTIKDFVLGFIGAVGSVCQRGYYCCKDKMEKMNKKKNSKTTGGR